MISPLDWLWLYAQILLLLWIGFEEFLRPRGRNVYAIALVSATLVLVQGQAWWMLSKFEKQSLYVTNHLLKTINVDGARLANFYIGLSVLCFFVTYKILSRCQIPVSVNVPSYNKQPAYSKLAGYLLCVWSLFFGMVALNYLGGLRTVLTKPGQFFGHGATMFLVLVHVGRLQLLDKIGKAQKVNTMDILLFGSIVIFQLFNGRSWTLFFLFQLFLLINYSRRELPRRIFIVGFAVFLFVAIIFGTYRQFSGVSGKIDFLAVRHNYIKYIGVDNAVDWFYSTAEEGFTGLAGILTYSMDQGGISHDFGISNLGFWVKFVPYPIRLDPTLPFAELEGYISNAYPYKDSITRAGYESLYGHFGVIGVLGAGILLAFLVNKLHNKMLSHRRNRLIIALLSVYILLPLYGNLHFVFLFWMTEICGLFAYRIIQSFSKIIVISGLESRPEKCCNKLP